MSRLSLARTLGVFMLTIFAVMALAPAAVFASTQGRRNTAIGLSAAAIYSALRGHGGTALALGAGAAYAWKREADSRKHHHYHNYRAGHYSRYSHRYVR